MDLWALQIVTSCLHIWPQAPFGPAVQKVKTDTTDYALSIMRDCIVVKKNIVN